MRRFFVLVLLAAILAAVAATAFAAPQSVMLELKGEPGAESKYETTLSAKMDLRVQDPGSGASILAISPRFAGTATTIERIIDVADNGDLTSGTQIESFDFEIDVADLHARLAIQGPNGAPPQLIKLPPLPIHAVTTKRGKVVSIEGLDKLAIPLPIPGAEGKKLNLGHHINGILKQFSQPLYPDEPVAVGDSWDWDMVIDAETMKGFMILPMPPEAMEQFKSFRIPIHSTTTLVGFESVNGVECAKLEAVSPMEFSMPMPQGPGTDAVGTMRETVNTKVVTWFDYAAGRKAKEQTDVTVTMRVTVGSAEVAAFDLNVSGETHLK